MGYFGPGSYDSTNRVGLAGQVATSRPRCLSRRNGSNTAQVVTVEATSTSSSFTITKDGFTRTFSASGFGSAALAAAELLSDFRADSIAHGWFSASISSATITFTAREPGTAGDASFASVSNATVTETTAAANGAEILMGIAVMQGSTADVCQAPTAVAAVAQVTDATPTHVNSVVYQLGVQMLSGTYSGQIYGTEYTADGSATVQEIVEAIVAGLNALLPASTVAATEDNTKVTLTAEVAGVGFNVLVGNATTNVWTIAAVTANVTAALTRSILGIAVRDDSIAQSVDTPDDTPAYPALAHVNILERGDIWVPVDGTVAVDDDVYVRVTATGSEVVGMLRANSDSGDAFILPGAVFRTAATGTAASPALAKVSLNLPA